MLARLKLLIYFEGGLLIKNTLIVIIFLII